MKNYQCYDTLKHKCFRNRIRFKKERKKLRISYNCVEKEITYQL